jgi:hypothetical protein
MHDERVGKEELTNEERVKKALERTTGFPLELEVGSILRSRGYQVYGNQLFNDGELIREIDLEALLPVEESWIEQKWHMSSNLAIECKMSKKYSWVFHRNIDTGRYAICAQMIDPICLKFDRQNHLVHLGVFERYFREHICSSHTVLDAADGRVPSHDDIFDAINKVTKFVSYRLAEIRKAYGSARRDMIFFFPAIVFDGPLYESEHRSGALSVKAVDRTILRAGVISSLSGRLWPMYIDIIRRDRFASFLSFIESKTNSVNEMLANKKVRNILEKARSAADLVSSCRIVDLIGRY